MYKLVNYTIVIGTLYTLEHSEIAKLSHYSGTFYKRTLSSLYNKK